MPGGHGVGSRIRDLLVSSFRKKGYTRVWNNVRSYKKSDYVDFKLNGPAYEGMQPELYQGRTGRVWKVTKRAMGIEINHQKWWYRIDSRSRSSSSRLVYSRADLKPTPGFNSHQSAQPSPIGAVHRGEAGAKKRKSDIVWHCVHNEEAAQSPCSPVVSRATTKNRVVVPGL
ncbi:large ribosomal subunit protein eL21-like [Corylus avellana]|uniref:large ribosomal subunit protein eL21-like n=1 Tax=Corylus avellana TaxID=13451 RepID=UPI00286D09E0|nr:large ribosomal subunit protein eL21-like [Corylus avellana]